MFTPSRHFMDFHIAGFTYWDGIDVFDQLKIGTEVRLELEDDNPHDHNAVAIYYEDTKIGYIPQYKNSEISNLIRLGHGDIFEAKISSRIPDEHTERQFRVLVRVRNNE